MSQATVLGQRRPRWRPGKEKEMAYCSNCGTPLEEGQQFCSNCGQRIAQVEPSREAQVPEEPEGPAEPETPPMAQAAHVPVAPPADGSSGAPGGLTAEPSRGSAPLAPGWTYGSGATSGPQVHAPSPPPRRSLTWLWIALAALVVIAVACILVFAVFDDEIFGEDETTPTTISETPATTEPVPPTTPGETTVSSEGPATTSEVSTTTDTTAGATTTSETTSSTTGGNGAAATPEDAVLLLFQAMEDKDFDAFFAIMDPVALEEVTGGLPLDTFTDYMGEDFWPVESMKFSDLEFETEKTGATTARVTIVEGTLTITDPDGDTYSESVTEADTPVTFEVIQRDGAWYVDPEAMFGASGL